MRQCCCAVVGGGDCGVCDVPRVAGTVLSVRVVDCVVIGVCTALCAVGFLRHSLQWRCDAVADGRGCPTRFSRSEGGALWVAGTVSYVGF
eukprot:COSAG02_NODE_4605_length_5174_cov_18.935961_1_plen_90_part_00